MNTASALLNPFLKLKSAHSTCGDNYGSAKFFFAINRAERTVFTMKDENGEREISVADYFVEKYNYRLKYPRMPLVFSMRLKHANYYPVELLKIIPGQRIKMSKMTVTVQSAMTSRNSSMPRQHVELVQKILHESLRLERNPYMDAFGIELESTNLIQLKAKILPPAQIRFKDQAYLPRPRSVAFRTQAKFVNPARLKSIAIIIFDHAIDERQAGGFCEALHRYCRDQGISVMEDHRKWQIKEMRSCDNSEIKRKMERYRDEKVDILIGICQEKRPDVHDVLKYYEEACGMQTIQLCSQTVNKMMSQQGGRQTIDNVMRKFNLKCGGTNFHVDIPQECMGRSVCSNNETLRRKLFEHTQFIGFEISHGASRTLYNRAHGQMDGDPSVVGVSYSLTNSTELGGFTYLQTSREYKLQNLEKKFPECVNAYKEHAKRLPSKIVVYRVGMGEGDIKRLKEEIEEIRSTFDKIQPGYRPHLIVIVAQKNSHTRVFPARIEGHKAGEQNVPSGTCLDNGITSFGAEEFILVSQTPLIGTVRPCKYTILENDPKWTKNEISHLTYFRAFGHQVSYQPPSVPDVLYAAENLAKRGRNNWIVHKKMDNMQDVERKILKRYPELDTEEMRDELAAAIITDMSERMNGMTIMKRNFWA
uniref:Piwi domain-containing protein n=1 Tax=Caenorhabditis japonica TaxID=281687 RepID=A0A8R1DW79_CAEJA